MLNLLIIINLLFSNFQVSKNEHTFYISKADWHVGILLKITEDLETQIDAVKDFNNYQYIDIGWGDADFYQSPSEFDLLLAAKAILIPSNSVLRIQGYNVDIEQIIKWRDYTFKIKLTDLQFNQLCTFINNSFEKDLTNNLIVTSSKIDGMIKFYSSVKHYFLTYTCNTWVADALESAGFEIDSSDVITADELFFELTKFAILLDKK